MRWRDITEIVALLVLCMIAVSAIGHLGVQGKEIPLAIGSGIGGYLTRAAVDAIKSS